MNPKMPQKNARLLLVDDDPEIPKLISFYLDGCGYDITTAQNGQIALQILNQQKFDLILVDRMMPRMDGITFVLKIKETSVHDGLIIVMSAHDQENKALLEIYDHIYDIIPKPFTSHRLKLSIRNALAYKFLNDKYFKIINSVIQE